MALAVTWSKKADHTFEAIVEYLIFEYGDSVAKVFVKNTFDFIELLSEFPNLGSVENLDRNIRGFVLLKQVTVFYKVKKNSIHILNFYDNRRKPSAKRYNQ